MRTILTAVCLVLALCVAAPAGSIRLPLGNGRTVKVKGHARALANSRVSISTDAGYGAWSSGRGYGR